ncbi:MAG: RNA polymerase sigma-54 factor, partial [Deltaproteobacteria bacterium]
TEAGGEELVTGVDGPSEVDWDAYLDNGSHALCSGAGGSGDELPGLDATLSRAPTLIDHLRSQVQMQGLAPIERQLALCIVDEVNDDGYLPTDVVETVALGMDVEEPQVQGALQAVQRLDPAGVGARSLRECLALQAERRVPLNPLVMQIIEGHLPQVERRNLAAIAKLLRASPEKVAEAIGVITSLTPWPGRPFQSDDSQYITPDIYVHRVGDNYVISLNEDGLPQLRISNFYREAMQQAPAPAKTYIQEKMRSAAWLIRSIHMRQRTIYRVMESILKLQRDFFDKGIRHLHPLILKEVAEDVGMHESTISRVTTNKYVHTAQGIYELKYFFNSSIHCAGGDSIASESVRNHIEKLIAEEDLAAPYSDQRIVEILRSRHIDIARRTVAKYREMLKIPSSSRRRRVF